MLPISEKKETVYEVVMFTVKPTHLENFLEQNREILTLLSNSKGFQNSNTYQSHTDEKTFVDIVAWDSLEDAQNAAAQFMEQPEFAPYMEAIESVKYNFHFKSVENAFLTFEECTSSDVLEFALFSIKEGVEKEYLASRETAMNHIHKLYPGFRGILTLQDTKEATQFLDLPVWSSSELAHKAQKELMEDPTFCAVMQYIDMEKPLLVENLRKVR